MSQIITITKPNQQAVMGIPTGKLNDLDKRVKALENNSGGIKSINADTTSAQLLTVGTSGTDFAISDNGTGTHTFNLPTASSTNRGALSSADWTTFNNKGNGTVTSVTSADANATVANQTTTPIITIVSAPKLQTARTIGGVSFDGTTNITVASATGGFAVSGGALTVGAGSVGSPSVTFVGDTDNGLYYIGTNNYGLSAGGSKILDIATTGLSITGGLNISGLTASKVVFTDASKNLTSIGIGTSSQFIKGDGSLDSNTYLTGNQTITLSGDASGSGATSIAVTVSKSTNLKGGNSTTLLGSLPYQSNTDTTSLLSPNTTTTKKFLRMTGTGTNGAAPAWDTVSAGDITGSDLTVGSSLSVTSGSATGALLVALGLNTIQGIRTSDTPQFAGLGIGQVASAISVVSITGTRTGSAPSTTQGAFFNTVAATYTNNSTSGGAQAPDFGFHVFGQPTIDGADGGTYSNHVGNVYIKGQPLDTSGTNRFVINNPYSLWVDAGNVRIDDKLIIGGNTLDTARTWSYDISFNDNAAKTIGIERTTTAATAGRALTISSGSAVSGGTNLNAGTVTISTGTSVGSGSGTINFQTATAGGSGTTDRTPTTKMSIAGNAMTMTATSQFNAQVNIGSTNWGTDTNVYVRSGATSPAIFYVLYDSTYKDALSEKEWFTANNNMFFGTSTAHSIIFYTNGAQKGYVTSAGSFVLGGGALATNATDGFTYIPTCAGTPTGVPTAQSSTKAMVYDTTGNKLWVYNGAWKSVALT